MLEIRVEKKAQNPHMPNYRTSSPVSMNQKGPQECYHKAAQLAHVLTPEDAFGVKEAVEASPSVNDEFVLGIEDPNPLVGGGCQNDACNGLYHWRDGTPFSSEQVLPLTGKVSFASNARRFQLKADLSEFVGFSSISLIDVPVCQSTCEIRKCKIPTSISNAKIKYLNLDPFKMRRALPGYVVR